MSELKISYFGNKVEIKGDIGLFSKPKLRHWLKTNFEIDFSDNSKRINCFTKAFEIFIFPGFK